MLNAVEVHINTSNAMIDILNCNSPSKETVFNVDGSKSCDAINSIPLLIHSNLINDFSSSIIGGPTCQNELIITDMSSETFNSYDICYSSSPKSPEFKTMNELMPFHYEAHYKKTSKDCKSDCTYSHVSDNSTNEEVVKVTNASSLDLTCILHVTPPQINNYPDIVRISSSSLPNSEYNSALCSEIKEAKSIFNSDHGLLIISPQNDSLLDGNMSHELDQHSNNSRKKYVSIGVQTIPVQIFPMANEVKIIKMIATEYKKGDEPESRQTRKYIKAENSIFKDKSKNDMFPGPSFMKSEIMAHCRLTAQYKDKENTDIKTEPPTRNTKGDLFDKDTSDDIWGDVYNDYIQLNDEQVDRRLVLDHDSKKVKIKQRSDKDKIDDIIVSGGDKKKFSEVSHHKKDCNVLTLSPPSTNKKDKKDISKASEIVSPRFEKIFELSLFDEMAKSYLTPSDRRIRSVCSKIGCKIRLFGPTSVCQTETSRQSQHTMRMKNFYYISISADTKDRLDKSVKCVQETFPKTFLNERFSNMHFSDARNDEIPL